MGDQRTAPEGLDPQASDDTPDLDDVEQEPVDEPAGEPAPDQSASGRIAQGEYTRATQLAAGIRRELGLPKTATQAEVIAALTALKTAPASADDDEPAEELSDREKDALERARAAELRVATAMYGEEFTTASVELINLARSSDDLDELLNAVAAFRDQWGAQLEAAAADEGDEDAEEDDDDGDPAGLDTSEGDRAPQSTQPSGGRRESGVVGAVRGLFAAAADEAQRARRRS